MHSLFHTAYAALMAVALGVAPPASQGPATFELIAPTGPFPVGTTSWVVTDSSRQDAFAPGTLRQVRVVAWYPASEVRNGRLAPYLREGAQEARSYETLQNTAGALKVLQNVFGHGLIDAPPAPATSFPLLVFSHGHRSVPSASTQLLEDLASHGYVVLSVVHPYEASAATLADGTVVTMLDERGATRPETRAVLGEWVGADAMLAAVMATQDEARRLAMVQSALAALPHTNAMLRRWVDDTRVVLEQLKSLPPATAAGRVAAKADLARMGVFGHGFGGIVAGQYCAEERRCRAGLNLDGRPQYGTPVEQPLARPFLMVYSDRQDRDTANDAVYQRSASVYYRIKVHETLLPDFTDLGAWPGSLRDRGLFGPIAPAAAVGITRRIAREFFDQELLGRRSPLLTAKAKWAWQQVSVEVYRPSKQ